VLGTDQRLQQGRGKPAPDGYLLALETLNLQLAPDQKKITPDGCLVFEESVVGVEAGRRDGMRVVWVPHSGLADAYRGREKEVLAGRIGLVDIGDQWQLGEIDGLAESLRTLEEFDYKGHSITVKGD
jgi:pseudouridine 5'-phosphatase